MIRLSSVLLFVLSSLVVSYSVYADFEQGMQYYEQGKFSKAFVEFKKLAETGDTNAQFNLGTMYLDGDGVEKDLVKAYAWIKLSDQETQHELDLLEEIKKQIGQDKQKSLQGFYQTIHSKYDKKLFLNNK